MPQVQIYGTLRKLFADENQTIFQPTKFKVGDVSWHRAGMLECHLECHRPGKLAGHRAGKLE
jgi:hypothetical protein